MSELSEKDLISLFKAAKAEQAVVDKAKAWDELAKKNEIIKDLEMRNEQLRAELAHSRDLCTKFESAVGEDVGTILQLRAETGRLRAIVRVNLMRSCGASHAEIDAILDPPDAVGGSRE